MSHEESITSEQFESILVELCEKLTLTINRNGVFESSGQFESAVGTALGELLAPCGLGVDAKPHPHVFPDFPLGRFGVEVKFTKGDTWRCVANSVFETTKAPGVEEIFVIFGKMGGTAEVRYDRYEHCVMHVRTSHVPRFEEYWGENFAPETRIVEWLKRADDFAVDWAEKPSACLFLDGG